MNDFLKLPEKLSSGLQKLLNLLNGTSVFKAAVFFIFIPLILMLLSLVPSVQDALIHAGELIKGRELNADHWRQVITHGMCCVFVLAAVIFAFLSALKYRKHEKIILVVSGIVSAAVSLVTVFYHEPWNDEITAWWYAWKFDLDQLLFIMKNEGHFLPWYFILLPFAKAGLPPVTASFISWIINCFIIYLFVTRAPFRMIPKIIVLFTSLFLFWNPVVSRPYVFISLILFLIARLYEKRNEKPLAFALLIAALANTHVYIEGLAGILSLYFLIEDIILPWKTYNHFQKKRHVQAFAIIVCGALIAFLSVLPVLSGSSIYTGSLINVNKYGLYDFLTGSEINWDLVLPFSLCLGTSCAWILIKDRKFFIILITSYAWMGAFSCLIYPAWIANRALLWFVTLIFVLWLYKGSASKVTSLIIIVMSLFIIRPQNNINDVREDFSCLHAAAQYIKENYPSGYDVYELGYHPLHMDLYLPDYKIHGYDETRQLIDSGKIHEVSDAILIRMDKPEFDEYTKDAFSPSDKDLGSFHGLVWHNVRLHELNTETCR